MTKRMTIFSLGVLTTFLISALPTPSASAQTMYECAPAKPGVFKDAHCKEKTNPAEGFSHVLLPANTSIPITWSNVTTGTERSTGKIKSIQSGITLELQTTEAIGEGELQNKSEGGTTWVEGFGTVVYKGVTVTLPAGKGCFVPGGQITTKELKGTSKGLTNQYKFEPGPGSGGIFAAFRVEGCIVPELNHEYTATGSFIGTTEGATTKFEHGNVTTQNTFKLFGQKTGLDITTTARRKSTGNALALT